MARRQRKEQQQADNDFGIGKVMPRQIEAEMSQSYLSYAMSVIVARALPDVRDGLKPVHRRILFSMSESGLRHSAKYRKSAEVSGTVIAYYHPHGNVAVYDAMVRLAQPWNLRYPLVDGQGNFGSIDGDPAAAERYTEARMAAITEEILADLDKDTVDFQDNYSNTKKEPKVLPTRIPQLLLNGAVGIAVGMATNIPPHNLREMMGAITHLIDNPEADLEALMGFVKGPDFPTGGLIFNPEGIKEAYATGRGKIVIRGVAEIEEDEEGHQIIISELPYQVNKAELVTKIAELVKEKKIVGIQDLRDESDRNGIRVAVDLKRDAYPRKVLNQLFKLTQLQSNFHVNLLALENGIQPRVFDLKSALVEFIKHRRVVVVRRTQYELMKAEERAHILEGLKIALDNLDAVIATIKKSGTKEEAHQNLVKQFKLTDVQAQAILEMRLQALAGLERQKVEDEYLEKQKLIAALRALLADPDKIDGVIKDECNEIKERYGDDRRTEVSGKTVGDFTDMDLIPNEEVVVTMTVGNYIKRQSIAEYRTQRRGGKGVIGMTTKEEDQISTIQAAKNHDDILFFTNRGRVFRQKVFEIPQASRIARGTSMVNLIQLAPEEQVTALLVMADKAENEDLVMVTQHGVIKKTAASAYMNIRSNGLIAINLDEGDQLHWVRRSRPGDEVVIVTRDGQSIKFKESDARPLGRSTRGVRAIKLRTGDEVVGADVAKKELAQTLLVVSENGLGKQTPVGQYTLQNRGGVGIKTMKVTAKTGKIVGTRLLEKGLPADLIITSNGGQIIRMPITGVPTLGRATQGVRLMRTKSDEKVASFTVLVVEGADKELSNPNAELEEGMSEGPSAAEIRAAEEEAKAAEKELLREEAALAETVEEDTSKVVKPAKKIAKVETKPAAKKAAPAVKPKTFTTRKLASSSKPKGFTTRKLEPKKPATKKDTKQTPKPTFKKRKLK